MACDGWTLITPEQSELAYRYLEIMRQMNRATYSPPNPAREVERMCRPPCEYYCYAGSGFEIVLGFKWINRLKRHRVMSAGFVGAIGPAEALDHIAAKMREYARRKGVDRLVAILPWRMDHAGIMELHQMLFRHPTLQLRGGHSLAEGKYVWIRFSR